MPETEDMKFPIVGADKCPACGSEKKICKGFLQGLREKYKLPAELYKDGLRWPVAFPETLTVAAMLKPEVPILSIHFEVCGDCFTIYCTLITLDKQPVKMELRRSPGPFGNKLMEPPFYKG